MMNNTSNSYSSKKLKLTFRLIGREKLVSTDGNIFFDLKPIIPEELKKIRKRKIPGFILKVNQELFFTEIPYHLYLADGSIFIRHLCAGLKRKCCLRLSAKPDEYGGCEKVRNKACYIERYPWITLGYETINVYAPQFIVCRCEHFTI